MNNMPENLRHFLEAQSPEQADELWKWLDETPDVVHVMMKALPIPPKPKFNLPEK
jgi:hypothetical protein